VNFAIGIAALMLFEVLVCLWFHERGYQRGKKAGRDEGYAVGRIDADNWWLDVEQQVDRVQQKIWRENPKSGKGYRA